VSAVSELEQGTLTRGDVVRAAALAALAPVLVPLRASGAPGGGQLRELARLVRGPVLVPSSTGFANASAPYNLRYSARRPRAVVQPLDARDVQEVVRWAARTDALIAARSGGHSYAAYSAPQNGVVVDLSRIRGVAVQGGVALVGAGAQAIDIHARLAPRGLVVPTGTCPSVGISGLTLGGGYGMWGRRLGLTCDRLAAVHIVTPDGQLRRATSGRDADLFWACRGGGGGNFGIVTRFDLRTYASRSASWLIASWPWSMADELLDAWNRLAPDADPRLTSLLTISGGGGLGVRVIAQYDGSVAAMRAALAQVLQVPGGNVSSGREGALALVRRWAGCLDTTIAACHTAGTRPGGTLPRNRFAATSGYIETVLDGPGRRALIGLAEQRQRQGAGGGALILDAYGGAIGRVGPRATAFAHRDARVQVQAYAGFSPGGLGAARRWLASCRTTLGRLGDGSYVNYIDPDRRDWADAYYGANLDRLRTIKQRIDPDRVFRFAQAVPG
jgi:FAD/FMN-containing dehydrogenase